MAVVPSPDASPAVVVSSGVPGSDASETAAPDEAPEAVSGGFFLPQPARLMPVMATASRQQAMRIPVNFLRFMRILLFKWLMFGVSAD